MKRRHFVAGSSAALAAGVAGTSGVASSCAPGSGDTSALLIRNVSLFDSGRGVMVPDQTVLVEDGVIRSVGRGSPATPSGTESVDGRGKYLLPGFIDAHVHLTHMLYQSRMTGDEILPFFLAAGVTSVRSTGDSVPAQRLVQRYAESHPRISPRVYMASFLIGSSPPHHPDVGWSLDSAGEVPAFVEHMAGWGVTTLKLYINVNPEVGRRVIEEGHRHGLKVAGHLMSYHPADAADHGLDSLEHIYTVADFIRRDPDDRHTVDIESDAAKRLIDKLAEKQVAVDPTLMVFWGTLFFVDDPEVINHADNAPMPRRLVEFWNTDNPRRLENFSSGPMDIRRRTFERYQELTGKLHRAGVPILVGTDAPEPQVPPGTSMHHEMEFLVDSGLSPAEVLTAATLTNAGILGESRRLGSIEAGKAGDMVLLDANPLDDIRNTRRIAHVISRGVPLVPSEIRVNAPTD